MESLQRPHNIGHLADSPDAIFVSGIRNILVATIQEAKDKISQIELLFHSQLIPQFQLNSQSWKKTCSESRLAADIAYKEKDNHSLFKIKKLECAEQQVLLDNQLQKLASIEFINMERQSSETQAESTQKNLELNEGREIQIKLQNFIQSKESLIHSYENAVKELKEKETALLETQKALKLTTNELRLEVVNKSKEVDELIEMQAKLILMNQLKASSILQKEEQLKEYEDKTSGLIIKLANAEKTITELQSALREKTDEVDNGKEFLGNLLKKIEYQASEILNTKELSSKYDKENGLLITKVEILSDHADELQKELDTKISELEKERQSLKQLLQQIDALNLERIKMGQEFEEFEKERKLFQDKKKYLEAKVDKLQECLFERGKESSEGIELHGKLLQQIQEKNLEVESQKRKRREVITAYKQMKSQYNSLRKSCNLTPENILAGNKTEDVRYSKSSVISCGRENYTSKAFDIINVVTNQKGVEEIVEDKNEAGFQISSPVSPSTSSYLIPPKCPTSAKSCPVSYWRNTRSHQSRLGSDPHDDFLDTPLEKVRENISNAMEAGKLHLQEPSSVKTDLGNSDDETQDMNMDTHPQQQPMAPRSSVLKYVEQTRKKSERENLKGVECKQCSKFYDAVQPVSNKIHSGNNCEHHDEVSRHRYRYAPPSTPDGFWNIEFESEA